MLKIMNLIFDNAVNIWGSLSHFLPLNPLVVRLRITNRCNLSCHYCYVGSSLNKKNDQLLTLNEWQKIIDQLPFYTLIDITGGEPLLTPNFSEILSLMLKRKLKVSLITNGTVRKEGIIPLMVSKKLMHLMVSLDGPQKIHDQVRGEGSFKKALDFINEVLLTKRELKSKYPKIVAKLTVTPANATSLMELCEELIVNKRVDGITLNLLFENEARNGFADGSSMDNDKFLSGNRISFRSKERELMVQTIFSLKGKFGSLINIRPDISLSELSNYFAIPNQVLPRNCHKHQSIVTIYQDGVITPCDLGLAITNIRDLNFSLKTLSANNKMQAFKSFMGQKKAQRNLACAGCCLKKHVAQ